MGIVAADEMKIKLEQEGFSKISFSLGLLNISASSMILVGLPAYFWVFHAAWLLSVGVDCPNKAFFSKSTRSDNTRAHAAMYLAIHFAAVALSFVWPPLCWNFEKIHIAFGFVIFLSAIWNSASYYEFLLMKRTPKALRKLIQHKNSFH